MKKKNYKGCLGNVVDSIFSDPIKKKKSTETPPLSVDSLNRSLENEPVKKRVRPQTKT